MKKELLLLIFLLASIVNGIAQPIEKKINVLIAKAISLNRFNGTVRMSKGGNIIYEKAFGYQDFKKKSPNSIRPIFSVQYSIFALHFLHGQTTSSSPPISRFQYNGILWMQTIESVIWLLSIITQPLNFTTYE